MTTRIQLTPDQEQKLRELGSYLREIRLQRSLSIESISLRTRIQARLLRAIEDVNPAALPEPVYVRALVKQYADALGLRGDDFASAFPAQPGLQGLTPSWKHLHSGRKRPFRLYLIYILALISLISGVSILVKRSAMETADTTAPANSLAQSETEAAPEAATTSQGVGVSTTAQPPATQTSITATSTAGEGGAEAGSTTTDVSGKNVVVSMQLEAKCWLRIVADGQVAFEGTLEKGEQRTWKANEQITIVAGNAGGVVIALNDQEAKPLGDPGSVQTVTYRPGSASSSS